MLMAIKCGSAVSLLMLMAGLAAGLETDTLIDDEEYSLFLGILEEVDEDHLAVITTPTSDVEDDNAFGGSDSFKQAEVDTQQLAVEDSRDDILQAGEAEQVVDDVLADYEEDLVEIVGQDGFERTQQQLLIVGVTSLVVAILLLAGILVFISRSGRTSDQSSQESQA